MQPLSKAAAVSSSSPVVSPCLLLYTLTLPTPSLVVSCCSACSASSLASPWLRLPSASDPTASPVVVVVLLCLLCLLCLLGVRAGSESYCTSVRGSRARGSWHRLRPGHVGRRRRPTKATTTKTTTTTTTTCPAPHACCALPCLALPPPSKLEGRIRRDETPPSPASPLRCPAFMFHPSAAERHTRRAARRRR